MHSSVAYRGLSLALMRVVGNVVESEHHVSRTQYKNNPICTPCLKFNLASVNIEFSRVKVQI